MTEFDHSNTSCVSMSKPDGFPAILPLAWHSTKNTKEANKN